LGVAVKVDGVCYQGRLWRTHFGITSGKSFFHITIVFGVFAIQIQSITLNQLHISKGFDVVFVLKIIGFVAGHNDAVVVDTNIASEQSRIWCFDLVDIKEIGIFYDNFFGSLRQKVLETQNYPTATNEKEKFIQWMYFSPNLRKSKQP